MIRITTMLALCALVACKGRQQAQPADEVPVNTEAARPDWVRSRPASSSYYIGVGLASKSRSDHQETAKKNALNDLASEISVTVEGNSLLYTLDQRTRFDESFTSTIRTTTNEQIEGFELVDTWENGAEYWTYYRLSKAEHARIKAERKAKAVGNALDLHARSKTSIAAGDLKSAMDQDLRALLAMKAYWGENDVVEIEGKQLPLVNEIYNGLQKLTSGVRIAVLPERCELNYANHFKRELLISASFTQGTSSRDLVQLPLSIAYSGLSGKVTEMKSTDAEGRLRTSVQRVDPEASASNDVVVKLDMDGLVSKELEPALVKVIVGSLTIPAVQVPITMQMPRVHMRAQESNLGQPVGDAGIAVIVREELTRKGFRFVERESEAELLLMLTASTRQGGESEGFFSTYLDVAYNFRDRKSQDTVHEGTMQGVKGVQLNYAKAGLDAYKKAGQALRKDLVPAMMGALQ
ncbi:MAG: LPP20 family lipoprotein [Flavobacteriales bacterium]|nr:LPP20 family lipoprotein [Flavobacteriales bacterium]